LVERHDFIVKPIDPSDVRKLVIATKKGNTGGIFTQKYKKKCDDCNGMKTPINIIPKTKK
jgi:hypothetical protein